MFYLPLTLFHVSRAFANWQCLTRRKQLLVWSSDCFANRTRCTRLGLHLWKAIFAFPKRLLCFHCFLPTSMTHQGALTRSHMKICWWWCLLEKCISNLLSFCFCNNKTAQNTQFRYGITTNWQISNGRSWSAGAGIKSPNLGWKCRFAAHVTTEKEGRISQNLRLSRPTLEIFLFVLVHAIFRGFMLTQNNALKWNSTNYWEALSTKIEVVISHFQMYKKRHSCYHIFIYQDIFEALLTAGRNIKRTITRSVFVHWASTAALWTT